MGRPSLGQRKQVAIRVPLDQLDQIDEARGTLSRDLWYQKAAALALTPQAQVADPDLKQDTHVHSKKLPLRTEWHDGRRVRVYQCSCGTEIT